MLLARFQQYFEIQRSLIHTFTSFILLSYSRFILVSFLLLTTTPLFDRDGQVFGPRYGVVYYDGTIPFFSLSHAVVAAVSTFVLVVFAIIVPSLLVFPSLYRNLEIARKIWETFDLVIERFMTKRFPKVNVCCEMNIINQFLKQYNIEPFNGFYRDGTGTTNEFDYRWCGGFYFILRIAIFAVYAFTPDWFEQYSFFQLFCTAALLIFVLLRPYKDDYYNKLDASMFALLLGINTLTMYNYSTAIVSLKPSYIAFSLQYIFVLLPLFYISFIIVKHCHHRICAYCTKRRRVLPVETLSLVEDTTQSGSDEFLNAVADSGRLDSDNQPVNPRACSEASKERLLVSGGSNGGSYGTQTMDNMHTYISLYGSVQENDGSNISPDVMGSIIQEKWRTTKSN